jgi:crotonobetainyl-CoA:carnitine CoA-transferase CaiB-like acyl-CoA transferase
MTGPDPDRVLSAIWALSGLSAQALEDVTLTGRDPVLPSSFAVGCAAQTPIAAAALAAGELGALRGQARRLVSVDMAHAAMECTGWFSIDGRIPDIWDKFSGLYRCMDGWVRVHANFEHHRTGALRLLGLDPGVATRASAEAAMLSWRAEDFEDAAAQAGLAAAAFRRWADWDAHPQGQTVAALPLMRFERIGEAPPVPLPGLRPRDLPLGGVRVLDLTRILAGPVCGRTLAFHGADVMLVNSPHLPNIASIADTSRGKLSCHLDLRTTEGLAGLARLVEHSHVFTQGYRPGALDALGFSPRDLAALRPGIVCVALSAYGAGGPWSGRRGFDSLVQTATGFNHAEQTAAGADIPRPMPMQILDYATGHLMAFAVAAALARQQREGGSWLVELSLAQTAHWLRRMGRVLHASSVTPPPREAWLQTVPSGYGPLTVFRHAAEIACRSGSMATPALRPSMPPGSHAPMWP